MYGIDLKCPKSHVPVLLLSASPILPPSVARMAKSAAAGIPLMRAASRTQSAVSGRMDGKTTLVRSAAKAASGNNHRAAKRKITVLIEVFP